MKGQSPHNQFMDVLVSLGYPGLALVLAFYLVLLVIILLDLKDSYMAERPDMLLLLVSVTGAIAGYSVLSMFQSLDPFTGDALGWVVLGMPFAVHMAISRRKREGRL